MADETVVVGGLSHETNTFLPEPTTREEFQRGDEYVGEAMFEDLRGTNTVVGGALSAAAESGVELLPTVYAGATPGGMVSRDAYEFYVRGLVDRLAATEAAIDGVLLALHGAMVPEGTDDGEEALIGTVRDLVGPSTPIVVTLDLHGNVSDAMVERSDALVAFETYPHADTAETGERGLEILLDIIRGELEPVQHVERPPITVAGPPQRTRGETPVAELMDLARQLETRPGVRKVNLFTGFQQADVPFMGPSVPVVGSDEPAVRDASRELAAAMWDRREGLVIDAPPPAEAVETARARLEEADPVEGPIVLADLGDNPGAGCATDTTFVLRELVDQGLENAGFALVRDPAAVSTCIEAGVGATLRLRVGGKAHDTSGEPLETEGSVKALTDGTYVRTGPMRTGTRRRLGRTALVELGHSGGIAVILTEERVQPLDTELWRHVGIQPERLDVIVVKSTNHFRAAYERIASEVISVNSPGLAAEDPQFYDYDTVTRSNVPQRSGLRNLLPTLGVMDSPSSHESIVPPLVGVRWRPRGVSHPRQKHL